MAWGCRCSEDGVSGGVATGIGGCADHDADGIVWCYLQTPHLCADPAAEPSVAYPPPVAWIECEVRVLHALCNSDCFFARDGWCDDGGAGADLDRCAFGSDCHDCGLRSDPDAPTCNEAHNPPASAPPYLVYLTLPYLT